MPSIALSTVICRELLSSRRVPRVPEPDLVMEDADQVDAYARAGLEVSVMKPTHLFHTAHACEVIRPGDRVLDLGCGPATQLAQIASLNPDTQFLGIDLSQRMLHRAEAYVNECGLANVALQRADMEALDHLHDASVDAVVCSMTLHHLSSLNALRRCLAEVDRVLRPGGGVYMADWCRLKTESSMRYFAYDHADRQTESFTRDYWNSLRAAFSIEELREAGAALPHRAGLFRTFPAPIMAALKSPRRRELCPRLRSKLRTIRRELDPDAIRDFRDMTTLFRLGGMRTPGF